MKKSVYWGIVLLLPLFHQCNNEPQGTAVSFDGVEIKYDVNGKGEPALVFVHGFSRHRQDWKDQMDNFSKNHKVVAIDLAGFGESGNNRSNWTMSAFGEDVASVIKELEIDEAILVGHSMGTPVIIKAAQLIPERVIGLVPVDMLHDVGEMKTESQIESIVNSFMNSTDNPDKEELRGWFVTEIEDDLVIEFYEYYANVPREGWEEIIRSTLKWMSDSQPDDLKNTKAPIICINSDLRIPDKDLVRKYDPDFDYKIIEGIGHMVMWEAPDEFNKLLEECIQEFNNN